MPVYIDLPATIDADCTPDDPLRLTMHEVHGRPVPADPRAYVAACAERTARERRDATGGKHDPAPIDPEAVTWRWPDGAEATWDADFGWSVPRVPPAPPKLPATVEEAEAEYQIELACGVSEAEARRELQAHIRRIELRKAEAEPECSHSPDFTSVVWFGTRCTFSKGNQAEAVRVLWEAWEAGGHSLSQETICQEIGSAAERFELRKVFRIRKPDGGYATHPAWDTMIVADGKGCYRLAPKP